MGISIEQLKKYLNDKNFKAIQDIQKNKLDFDINQYVDEQAWDRDIDSMNSSTTDQGHEKKRFIHLAIDQGDLKILALFLKIKDIDIDAEYSYKRYYRRTEGGFFSSVNECDSENTKLQFTAAEYACYKEKFDVATFLLEQGSKIREGKISAEKLLKLLMKVDSKKLESCQKFLEGAVNICFEVPQEQLAKKIKQ